jgi:hypothetical protein
VEKIMNRVSLDTLMKKFLTTHLEVFTVFPA